MFATHPLGLDLVSGAIVCPDLTTDGVGDSTALPDLLGQVARKLGAPHRDWHAALGLRQDRHDRRVAISSVPHNKFPQATCRKNSTFGYHKFLRDHERGAAC